MGPVRWGKMVPMSRSADITSVLRRSALLVACLVAAVVMLVTGHVGWGILSGVVTIGGAVVASRSLGTLRSTKANLAVLVPAVVVIVALVAAF